MLLGDFIRQPIYFKKIPEKNSTINNYVCVDKILNIFKFAKVYFKCEKECSSEESRWVIDFFINESDSFPERRIHFNPKMTQEHMSKFIKPLMDKIKLQMN